MAYDNKGQVISLIAGDTLSAHRLVYISTTTGNTVGYVETSSSSPVGVTVDYADSGAAIGVQINGVAKLQCAVDVVAGDLVCMSTAGSGQIKPQTINLTATSTNISIVGIALEAGSVSSLIPVLLQMHSPFQR